MYNDDCRITLDMSFAQIISTMSEGNPGAVRVVTDLLAKGGEIDPDSALGGMGPILELDMLKVYGHKIWLLYKDICGESLTTMVALLRATQLGITDFNVVTEAIEKADAGPRGAAQIDLEPILTQVKERLPAFQL